MRIVDLKCALIGGHPVVRIVTDAGVDGYSQVETFKPYVREQMVSYKPLLVGQDPTQVERTMRMVRKLGGFKPWGAAVSAIEVALWDLAGKAAGLPIHRLLGGKIRDRVRVYGNIGGSRSAVSALKHGPEGFTIAKMSAGYHGFSVGEVPGQMYGQWEPALAHGGSVNRGPLTERGLERQIELVRSVKAELGGDIGLAVDCGPGWTLPDAIRFARALEPLNLLWLEDLLTGDYSPHSGAHLYKDLTRSTSTPIHTGEQIYLRQNFMELIEGRAVDVIGPDPLDVGGIAELKWIAEYADLHGILIAPHGVGDGIFGLAALVQVAATLPQNFIAFEYPRISPEWWFEIVQGFSPAMVQDGHVAVSDRPGLGLVFDVVAAKSYLSDDDAAFFE